MLIGRFIAPILIVTGVITALPVLQFFFPRFMLRRLSNLTLTEEGGIFFARHWGLVTLTIGALLVIAARDPAARPAIVMAVLVEKIGYAWLALGSWNRLPGLRASGLFDALCSALYLGFLLGG